MRTDSLLKNNRFFGESFFLCFLGLRPTKMFVKTSKQLEANTSMSFSLTMQVQDRKVRFLFFY